jgi:glycosyltransferase involved in cell wall biosynthesis
MQSAGRPLVSVVLPVRDGAPWLNGALSSIRGQTLSDFECLVVDDGSRDGSRAIARCHADRDRRVRVLCGARPRGLVAALRAGIAASRAPYVARMDADDVALPERLALEVAALDRLPDLSLVGCRIAYRPEGAGTGGLARYVAWQNSLLEPEAIRRDLFVESPLVHPTVVVRRVVLDAAGGYRDLGWPEDYDLWMRIILSGGVAAKLREVLLEWRDLPGRLSRRGRAYRLERFRRLKAHYLRRAWLRPGEPVQVAGAGPTGRWWTRELARAGFPVTAVIDVDPRRVGKRCRGVPIVGIDRFQAGAGRVLAAVPAWAAREAIRDRLRAEGLVELRDFVAVA